MTPTGSPLIPSLNNETAANQESDPPRVVWGEIEGRPTVSFVSYVGDDDDGFTPEGDVA